MALSNINLNRMVFVIPNSETIKCIVSYYDNLVYPGRNSYYNQEDADKWYNGHLVKVDNQIYLKMPLYECMLIFGRFCTMGSQANFESNQIYFDTKDIDGANSNTQLLAEFDNFRKRTEKEKADLVQTANNKLLGSLTEIYDDLDRAFYGSTWGKSIVEFAQGIHNIYTKFKKILSDNGLEQFDPTGTEFNPAEHEAIARTRSSKLPDGYVADVMQKGYKVNGKVIKHAKVSVTG